jgi:sialic acid synthase SpsE
VALGTGEKVPDAVELPTREVVRRSVVAARPIAAGQTITEDDLECRRPAAGRSAFEFWEIVGTVAPHDIAVGSYVG